MIEAQSELLAKEPEQALRRWLTKPERKTLELVVSSRAKMLQVAALRDAIGATSPEFYQIANGTLKEAQKYEAFLAILAEIENADRLEIVKLR